jgi:hypothetical protein
MEVKNNTTMKLNTYQPPSSILFSVKDQEEIIKITTEGEFYYKGKLAGDEKEVYEGFKKFLSGQGLIFNPNKEKLDYLNKWHMFSQGILTGGLIANLCLATTTTSVVTAIVFSAVMSALNYWVYRSETKKLT